MSNSLDPITLQVRLGTLKAICDEMGVTLIRAAHSSNIKERRDCSCALFDQEGKLIMQAEHIPVHLGAMPAAVEAVLGESHSPGVSWILNDPYRGGTHLPDITVIEPVFASSELIGFAANRAHWADVGGPTPGSMPADSRTLTDEGLVISPRPIDENAIEEITSQMRQPLQRRADLRAQLACNAVGVKRLAELVESIGLPEFERTVSTVMDYSERRIRAAISDLADGTYEASDALEGLDDEIELCLRATVSGEAILFDFTGSANQVDSNLNCPLAVTRSAVLFAVRVLTDPDTPPNAGALRPVSLVAPEGSVLNAHPPAAVVAGNTETSSRVADLVLQAFGHALGQGTMNNLSLASDDFTYYETVGGGQGACPNADGPSCVHVAMSNTLNTPIEALELEFPLRITEYSVRRGSGGSGRYRGGDGVVREYEALAEISFSLITERRNLAPKGAAGGKPGSPGQNLKNGDPIPSKTSGKLSPGESLRLETPGGGGHESPV